MEENVGGLNVDVPISLFWTVWGQEGRITRSSEGNGGRLLACKDALSLSIVGRAGVCLVVVHKATCCSIALIVIIQTNRTDKSTVNYVVSEVKAFLFVWSKVSHCVYFKAETIVSVYQVLITVVSWKGFLSAYSDKEDRSSNSYPVIRCGKDMVPFFVYGRITYACTTCNGNVVNPFGISTGEPARTVENRV